MKEDIKRIEDIYPLTIVGRRYGGMAIVNCDSFQSCVDDLQENEEWHYGDTTQREMEKEWDHIIYGVGETLDEAFKDFLKRKKDMDERPKRNYEDDPLTPEQEEMLKKLALAFIPPSLGSTLVSTLPMGGPPANLYYFDRRFSGA